MSLALTNVSIAYPGASRKAVKDLSLSFESGAHTAILGPNGAGKTTVLKALAGLLECESGAAMLDGTNTREWPRRAFAKKVAFVSSAEESAFPIRVRDYVALGRNPYLDGWRALSTTDRDVVESALTRADLVDFEARFTSSLSAGEMQRARIGRALAQDPEILLLDEPTAHLDLGHGFAAFQLLAELSAALSLTTISVTHNVNMASRFCSRIVLMSEGCVVADGVPTEVLSADRLSAAFRWPVETVSGPGLGVVAVPVRRK
jgi:iron complex transport system ATP-binding protein